MRALVVEAPGTYAVRQVPRPRPGRGEVLVRVAYCGLCGTDLAIAAGRYPPARLPLVIGHELAGEVAALGAGVEDLEPGQLVAVDPILEPGRELGIQEPGGLAELVVAPARNLHPLPEAMAPEAGALIEPLACALHGQDRAGIEPGDTVAVIGGGAQSLLHTALARLRGAARVVVSARHERRRERAAAMGADLVLEPGRTEPADVVIEASGSADACAAALQMVSDGGRVLLYGAAPPEARLPAFDVYARELSVIGSLGAPPAAWPRAIALASAGRIDLAALVDAEWPLEKAPEALERLARDRSLVKGLIRVAR